MTTIITRSPMLCYFLPPINLVRAALRTNLSLSIDKKISRTFYCTGRKTIGGDAFSIYTPIYMIPCLGN